MRRGIFINNVYKGTLQTSESGITTVEHIDEEDNEDTNNNSPQKNIKDKYKN